VTSDFAITGVPSGTYKVLVAFENDQLVRDPDEGIAGTAIQEITVGVGEATTVDQSFKVTAALSVVGPGSEGPEAVDPVPTFSWTDDSSEDGYNLIVFNALGDVVWEQDLASVSGSASAEVSYGGSDLAPGMYYQFRVTSYREQTGTKTSISRTEDLRGVFVTGEAPPAEACMVEDPGGSSTGD
jgi:hypothetical protein